MTVFEYIMVMVSVILALALAQVLKGLTEIPQRSNRYWVHTLWVMITVLAIIQLWWAFWDFNAIAEWSFTSYLYVLSTAVALFICAYLIWPEKHAEEPDLKWYFYSIRPWFFLALLFVHVVATMGSWIFLDVSITHPYRIFQFTLSAIVLLAGLASSHMLHRILVLSYLTIFLLSQLLVRMQLGALTG